MQNDCKTMNFFECYHCTEVFFIESEFEEHLKLHELPAEFKCQHENCEKSFKRLSELRRHEVNMKNSNVEIMF